MVKKFGNKKRQNDSDGEDGGNISDQRLSDVSYDSEEEAMQFEQE